MTIIHMMEGIHRAIRADVARLETTLGLLEPGDRAAARAVHEAFGWTSALIESHHLSEDEVMWPFLARRTPDFESRVCQLEDDHVELDAALARVRAGLRLLARGSIDALSAATRRRLLEDTARLDALLRDHLDREAHLVFPPFESSASPRESAALEAAVMKHAGLRRVSMVLPWVLANAPVAQQRSIRSAAPAPLVAAHDLLWRRRFARRMAPLYRVPVRAALPAGAAS